MSYVLVAVLAATTASILTLALAQRKAERIGADVAGREVQRQSQVFIEAGWRRGALAVCTAQVRHQVPDLTMGQEQGYRMARDQLLGVANATRLAGPTGDDAAPVQ